MIEKLQQPGVIKRLTRNGAALALTATLAACGASDKQHESASGSAVLATTSTTKGPLPTLPRQNPENSRDFTTPTRVGSLPAFYREHCTPPLTNGMIQGYDIPISPHAGFNKDRFNIHVDPQQEAVTIERTSPPGGSIEWNVAPILAYGKMVILRTFTHDEDPGVTDVFFATTKPGSEIVDFQFYACHNKDLEASLGDLQPAGSV